MASTIANARWISLSQGVRVLTQLVGVTLLARMLPPDAYGMMAMATVVTNLAYMFRDMGMGAAVIRMKSVPTGLVSTIHWSNLALGSLIAVLILAAASPVAQVFGEPGLTSVLAPLALVFPLSSLAVVHQALLERSSHFRTVAVAEIASSICGLAAAICMATLGAGVMSLVAQLLVASLASTLALLFCSGFKPALHWRLDDFKSIAGFSGNLSLFNLVLYISRNADSMIVGRLLGSAALGVYSIAYRVMLFPLQNMSFVASRALYPVLSQRQDSEREVAALYLRTVGFIAFLTAPLMAGLFALREPFVNAVLGHQWHAAIPILAWLAPVGFIQSIVSTTGTVFMARGRADLMLRLGVLAMVLQVGGILIGTRWGIEGVCAGYFLANVANAWPALHYSGRLIGVSFSMLLKCVAPAVSGSTLMALALHVLQGSAATAATNTLPTLLFQIAGGCAVYALLSLLLLRAELGHLRQFLRFG